MFAIYFVPYKIKANPPPIDGGYKCPENIALPSKTLFSVGTSKTESEL